MTGPREGTTTVLQDPTALKRKLRQHGAVILISMLVGVAAAYGLTMLIPPTYEATGSVLVTRDTARDQETGRPIDIGFARSLVPTVARLGESREVGQDAAARAGMPESAVVGQVRTEYTLDAQIVIVNVRAAGPGEAAAIANAVQDALRDVVERRRIDGFGIISAHPLDRALPPDSPVQPSVPLYCTLGGVLGLLAGLGLGRLRDRLDDRVRDVEALRETTEAPTLASIPFDRKVSRSPLALDTAGSAWSESFARLRTNLEYVAADARGQMFAVTSAVAGEGKSVTACNLAIAFASAGRQVVLVEANLRRPASSRYLGVRSQTGLTTVLRGQTDLNPTIQSWGDRGLMFLPAGPPVPNPSELLASEKTTEVLRALRERFDLVLLDLPSLLAVTDAAVLAGQVDGVLLVARNKRTSVKQIRQAVEVLNIANARTLGCVLNMTPQRDSYGHDTPRSRTPAVAVPSPRRSSTHGSADAPDLPVGGRRDRDQER
jgi:capsular exopolysaccharide synthesis family protein